MWGYYNQRGAFCPFSDEESKSLDAGLLVWGVATLSMLTGAVQVKSLALRQLTGPSQLIPASARACTQAQASLHIQLARCLLAKIAARSQLQVSTRSARVGSPRA